MAKTGFACSAIPADLETWLTATLKRNGLWNERAAFFARDPDRRHRLRCASDRKGMDIWTVDLSGLPIGSFDENLPVPLPGGVTTPAKPPLRGRGRWDVRIVLQGSRLCVDPTRDSPEWIRTRVVGFKPGACDRRAGKTLLEEWERMNESGPDSVSVLVGQAPGGLPSVHVRCSSTGRLIDLGRLQTMSLDTIEISDCELNSVDQIGLNLLDAEHLVLRELRSRELNLMSLGNPVKSVDLVGGALTSVFASNHDLVHMADLVLFDPAPFLEFMEREFHSECAMATPVYRRLPPDLMEGWAAFLQRWDRAYSAGRASRKSGARIENLVVRDTLEIFRAAAGLFKQGFYKDGGEEPDGFLYVEPPPTMDDTDFVMVRFGENWIRCPSFEYYMGDAFQARYRGKTVRSGMTKAQMLEVLGAPSFESEEFLAWPGKQKDPITGIDYYNSESMYRAHFDSNGILDSWMVDARGSAAGC